MAGPILPASTATPAPGHPPTDVLLAGPKARLPVEPTTDEGGGGGGGGLIMPGWSALAFRFRSVGTQTHMIRAEIKKEKEKKLPQLFWIP